MSERTDRRIAERLLEAIQTLQSTPQTSTANPLLSEALDDVRAMLSRDERGWQVFQGGPRQVEEGLSLADLKAWSAKLRESTVGAPWIKHGLGLRSSYVWEGGMQYDPPLKRKKGPGATGVPQRYIEEPQNQRAFFSPDARKRREGRLYYDGLALWIGNDTTKMLEAVPLDQITDTLSHPDYPGIIYAYKREWSRRQKNGDPVDMKRWYFVDEFKSEATDYVITGPDKGDKVKVERGWTAFDMHPNSFEGWALGVPDALAAWIWAGIAKDLYLDGADVSAAMATIAYKVTGSKNAQTNAAAGLASTQTAGSTAVMGVGTDLAAMPSIGKGYDFTGIRAVIALVAAALSISVIDLTSNPGDAGSSYGSAQTLETPTRLAMMERRLEHISLDTRVLRWMGAKDTTPYFKALDDGTEVYRRLQTLTLVWLQGAISVDKYKELAADILGVPALGETPDGILIPNNKDSLPRPDVDADGQPTSSTGSPTQGRSSGTGDGAAARDTRDDTIS